MAAPRMPASRLFIALLACASLAACAGGPQPAAPAPQAAEPEAAAPPDDASPYGLFLAGRAAGDEGRLGVASTLIGRAAEAEGEPTFLKIQAFGAALRAGDIAAAASLAPDGPDVGLGDKRLGLLVRGVEAMAQGKDKDAYAQLTGPDMGYPFQNVAQLLAPYAAAGAGDAAAATARPDEDGDGVAQFVADLDQAQLDERVGHRPAAEVAYKALLAGGDESGLITEAYAGFLERRGRWNDAAGLYRDRLARSPDDSIATAALARAQRHGRAPSLGDVRQGAAHAMLLPAASLMTQKQTALALDYLRLALRLDPASGEAWVLLGDLLTPADVDAARAAYAHVAPGSDRYVGARGKLAWTYQNAGDQDQALRIARETLAAAPDDRDAAVTLSDLLRGDDQYPEAAAILTRLIDQAADHVDWRLYYLRASAYEGAGDAGKTETDLEAALRLAPDEPELLNFQGYFWIDRGERLADALAMVQKALDAEPQSGEIMDSLGWGYYRLGDYKTAVEKLEAAVTLTPSIPEVNDHLGDAYWRVGRQTEAQFAWRRVLTLEPDDKLRASVEAKLASPLGPDAPPPLTPPAATSHP
jgi:tetratricopeptide (TPR) repeat protein